MMNRSLMGRQMFAKGGEAKSFPDYSGDGKITQKDILMGRGVLPMQEGGTVPMDPMMADPMMADPMMADPMMADPMMDPSSGFTPQNNPEVVQNAMMAAAENFGNLDDADDYESMINMIRGDQAPMAERVNELAELVGLEDAQQTPQSVVALIQPVMLMTNLDEGIGSIAQGAMDQEMTGDMAGGIMSTVNMDSGPEMSLDPNMDPEMGMGVGNEPPVNFRFGGPVARMQDGGSPSLEDNFLQRRELYNSLIAPQAYDQSAIAREKELTEAQMLFDIAGTALAFATPGDRQMSPAQRLAEAATETQLFDKLGARAKAQMTADQARKSSMREEKMKLDLAALTSAEAETTAQAKALSDANIRASTLINMSLPGKPGSAIAVVKGSSQAKQAAENGYLVTGSVSLADSDTTNSGVNFMNVDTKKIVTVRRNSSEEDNLINDPNFVLTGAKSQSSDSATTTYLSFRDINGKQIDVRADNLKKIAELQDNGATLINRPSIDKGPKLSDEVIYVSNSDRLASYADGSLDPTQTNQFEIIINNLTEPKETIDTDGVRTIKPGLSLPKNLQDAIRARQALGSSTPSGVNVPAVRGRASDVVKDLQNAGTNADTITVLNNYTDESTGFLDKSLLQRPEFKMTLLNNAGSADVTSETWKMIPTTIFDPSINYDNAVGFSSIPARFSAGTQSLGREFGLRDSISAEAAETNRALASLKALKLQTQGKLSSAVTEDRVLKSVQKAINDNIEGLTPRIIGFDANTLSTMKAVLSQLELQYNSDIKLLDEYGGNSASFDTPKVYKARQTVTSFEPLIAEYVKFIDAFEGLVLGSPNNTGLSTQEQRRRMYGSGGQ